MTCDKPGQSAHLLPPQPAGLGWTGQEWQPRLFHQSPADDGVADDEISKNTFVVKKVFFHLKRFLTDRDVGRVGKTSHFEFKRLLTISVNQRSYHHHRGKTLFTLRILNLHYHHLLSGFHLYLLRNAALDDGAHSALLRLLKMNKIKKYLHPPYCHIRFRLISF